MRSFALLSLSTALAFAVACNEQEQGVSATDSTTSGTTAEPQTTTETPDLTTTTTATTTGETTTTTTGMTTELIPTTGPEPTTGTTTTTTTGEPMTTTTGTTTGEPETEGTTEPLLPSMGPYESCDNDGGVDCNGNAVCVDAASTNNTVTGSFCAPKCTGMGTCPTPDGLDPDVQAICAFDTDADMMPDICALLCNMANDDCPEGSACEDIGIPEMQMMKFGVCTFPA